VTVKFSGGRELEAALLALGDQAAMRRTAARALRLAGEPIRAAAVALAPDDPQTAGNLKQAIRLGPQKSRDKDQVWVRIGIDSTVDPAAEKQRQSGRGSYRDPGVAGNAVIQEFGTPKMPANPFMRPAWDAGSAAAPGLIARELWDAIAKSAARLAKRASAPSTGSV
jgi:HK97 gp10 family phage protein